MSGALSRFAATDAATGAATISIIVPVHNGGEAFRACMAAVAPLAPRPLEIIVVANGDTDGSGDLAASLGVKVIRVPTPIGPAQARNLGAQAARGAILFFVDADVAVPCDLVARVARLFADDPALDAVTGSYDVGNGKLDGRIVVRLPRWPASPRKRGCLREYRGCGRDGGSGGDYQKGGGAAADREHQGLNETPGLGGFRFERRLPRGTELIQRSAELRSGARRRRASSAPGKSVVRASARSNAEAALALCPSSA